MYKELIYLVIDGINTSILSIALWVTGIRGDWRTIAPSPAAPLYIMTIPSSVDYKSVHCFKQNSNLIKISQDFYKILRKQDCVKIEK